MFFKFEVFEIISLRIGLVSSMMEHDRRKMTLGSNLSQFCELFCCLACDCNYRDEEL